MHEQTTPDVIAIVRSYAGSRLRVTWPNGCQVSGDVTIRTGSRIGLKPGYEPATWAQLGGTMVGGEYLPAVRIEEMQPNRRYTTVWTRDV